MIASGKCALMVNEMKVRQLRRPRPEETLPGFVSHLILVVL